MNKLMNYLTHWKYMATRRIYGKSRLSVALKALRLWALWMYFRKSDESVAVTCWKCEGNHLIWKRSMYYYDNTKCTRCYL